MPRCPAVATDDGAVLLDGLVDVIAEEQNEFGIFRGQVAVGGEISVFVIGAGDKAKSHLRDRRLRGRKRDRTSGRADRIAREEAVPVGPPRFETGNVEMDRIGEGLLRRGIAAAYDFGHAGIGRDLITQGHVGAAHPARRFRIGRQRFGRKPRPEHEAVGPRRAAGNAEAERIAGPPALRRRDTNEARRRDRAKANAGFDQEAPPADTGESGLGLHRSIRSTIAVDRHLRPFL